MRSCLATLALLSLATTASPALAQDDTEEEIVLERGDSLPVKITVRLGFTEKTPSTGFIPVRVTLTCTEGNRSVTVRIRSLEGENVLLDLGSAELQEQVPYTVHGIAPVKLLIEAGTLHVVCEDGQEVVGETIAQTDATYDQHLLILSSQSAIPANLSKLKTTIKRKKKGTKEERWITTVINSVPDLPHSPLGYTGIAAIILADLDLKSWSETQAQALASWVARGGNLIITLSHRGELRQSPVGKRLAQALEPIPYERTGDDPKSVSLRGMLSSLGPLDQLEAGEVKAPTLTLLNPSEEDVVLFRSDSGTDGQVGLPIVIQRRHGLGQVTIIACDLWRAPFKGSTQTTVLVEGLVNNGTRYRPRSRYLFQTLADTQQPAQIGPAFALLIIFALVAGPLVYFVLRAKKRGILLWLVIPGLTVAFTLVVPFYRLALKDGESTIVGVRVIETRSGDTMGVETIDALLFSGSLDKKRIAIDGEDAAAFAVIPPRRLRRRGRARFPDLGTVLGSSTSNKGLEFELPVALWGARYLSFERTWKVKPTTGRVELGMRKKKAHITIDYQGTLPLKDPVVLMPHATGPVAVPLGETILPDSTYDNDDPTITPIGAYESDGSGMGALVIDRLVQSPYKGKVESGRAFLIGQTDAVSPLRAEPNVRDRSFSTILVVELPVSYSDGVPFGVARASQEAQDIQPITSTTVTRRLKTRLVLPPRSTRKAKGVTLRLKATRGMVLTRQHLRLEGLFHGGAETEWRTISLDSERVKRDQTNQKLTIVLTEPAGWVSSDGALQFRQIFRRPRMATDEGHSAVIDVSVRWVDDPGGARDPPPPDEEESAPD